MWVNQWPLSIEKLHAAHQIIEEQLQLGHIETSTSPWNAPIFVIKKKSGKWRLLHDLRAINAQMAVMGPVQRGLPTLSALPKDWPVYTVDIKDCFFSIPLHPEDKKRFAFTVPSINHEKPDCRFQWRVLPQGMANSPTMCQLYVSHALDPVRCDFPDVRVIHYMDDILLAHPRKETLDKVLIAVDLALRKAGLLIAPEKIQRTEIAEFLGTRITAQHVRPQKIKIAKTSLKTLNDFQKLLGDINWVRSYLPVTRDELRPLFQILEGDPDLSSPRTLTQEGLRALELVEKALEGAQVQRVDPQVPLTYCILPTVGSPTGVFWQSAPVWWIHGHSQGQRTLHYYPEAVAHTALVGLKFSITTFGYPPDKLIIPYTKEQVEVLAGTMNNWAILMAAYSGEIDNHYPQDKLLQFLCQNVAYFPKVTSSNPIKGAIQIFTDGSKTGIGVYQVMGHDPVRFQFRPGTPQVTECLVVLEVFKAFSSVPFNLLSDSSYVVNAVRQLEVTTYIKEQSTVASIFTQIQNLIFGRDKPFYIGHIRAHSGLPGPLSTANEVVDKLTRVSMVMATLDPVAQATDFHTKFHVPADTLRLQFKITREQARTIVKSCKSCVTYLHPPHIGVNPRGLKPLTLWQMDVTHFSEFGTQKWVHVSVDTYSGVVFASALTGEKVTHVKTHCLQAWAAWGKPMNLKTDNGPAYTAKGFKSFCAQMQVQHTTGLPYNPQGQGIVERANRTLKELIQKQKGGIEAVMTPRDRLSLAIFTINFLILDANGKSAADRHAEEAEAIKERVMWKDILDNKWYGPDPVIRRSRGAVCVFPQDRSDPVWVPSRLTRKLDERTDDNTKEADMDSNPGDADSADDLPDQS